MLKIIHEPTKDFYNNYVVEATSINEVITEMIPKIRNQSQEFYRKNIREELQNKKATIIDRYAGNGVFYTIKII